MDILTVKKYDNARIYKERSRRPVEGERKTVDRLVIKGRLNSIKTGRLRMFTDRQLNQLISECEVIN